MVYNDGAQWSLLPKPRMENTMKSGIAKSAGALTAAALAFALSAGWVAAQPAGPGGGRSDEAAMHRQHRMEHMQMMMKKRIEKMASRLEIKASQQGPWTEYVRAREGMWANMPARPGRDADAATIARARADFAADMARKLAVVSDATAKLQAVLSPEQRKVFDEMARRSGRRGHHGGRGGEGRGGRDGWRHGGEQRGGEQRAPR
jgi:hypothetical protein